MKECFKYLMIILLAVCLHEGVADTSAATRTTLLQHVAGTCLTQAPTPQQNLRRYYSLVQRMSLCTETTISTQVPEKAYRLIPTEYIQQGQTERALACGSRPAYSGPEPAYPPDRYVYGLEEIII